MVEETFKFMDSKENEDEVGQITMWLKLKIQDLEDRIYEDVREIEKIYYDPFVTDEAEILRKLDSVETVLGKKQKDYDIEQERFDKRTEAMRGLAVDIALLQKKKDSEETLNT